MSRPQCISSILVISLLLVFNAEAHALKQIAPKIDRASANYRALQVYYNYNRANAPERAFTDRIPVFLAFRDKKILGNDEAIVAEVKITDLSDYRTKHVRFIPVDLDRDAEGSYKPGVFEITNDGEETHLVQPAKVYRIFVNLHYKSDEYGENSVIGRVRGPYYVATAGETRMDQARQQIVMRTFKEFYYRKRGWRSEERYPMDCYAYYMWATGFCTVGAKNGRTNLRALFGDDVPYHRGKQIAGLARRGPIHADYVRKPGHSFMLLSYDPKQKHVWCMEGNFNSTIEVVIRSVYSDWKVGHLVEQHIRPEL